MLGVKPSERCRQIPLDLWAELGSFTNSETVDAGTIGRGCRCSPQIHPKTGGRNRPSIVDGASKDSEVSRLRVERSAEGPVILCMTAQRAVPYLENQSNYSAYRMTIFPCSSGAITTGQEAGQMAAESTGRHDLCPILEKDRSPAFHHPPFSGWRGASSPSPWAGWMQC